MIAIVDAETSKESDSWSFGSPTGPYWYWHSHKSETKLKAGFALTVVAMCCGLAAAVLTTYTLRNVMRLPGNGGFVGVSMPVRVRRLLVAKFVMVVFALIFLIAACFLPITGDLDFGSGGLFKNDPYGDETRDKANTAISVGIVLMLVGSVCEAVLEA